MLRPRACVPGVICALALLVSACATRVPAAVQPSASSPVIAATPTAPAAPAPQPQPQPVRDPVADLVAQSNTHVERAQRALADGHLDTARSEFNNALELLMASPYGARSEPRLREHFDRLVERVSALEVMALAQADGFTEQRHEPATIDELLAIQPAETPAPTADTQQAVAEDLEETVHDIDIPLNKRVLSYVELFSGRLKSFLEEGLSRGAKYLPMIQDVFRAEGLPLDLAYVPLVESAFKPSALSRAKARGIWQFMRGTGIENGLAHDWYIDERADPEKATYAAAKYLKTLHGMFDGDWHLALASYNGGPGRVQRAMKRSGRKDFWTLSASTRYLPRETRDYVPLILAAVIIAKNPAQYGLAVQPFDSPAYETVTLPTAVDLRRIAEWIDIPVTTIQELNPELRRWTTPVRASDYELKVPLGTADFVRAHLLETPNEELAPLNRHTVKRGETLATIARKLKVSRVDLAEANYLKTNARLTTGQQLIVPSAPTLLLARRTDAPVPEVASRSIDTVDQAPPEAVVATAEGTRNPPSRPDRLVYRVKRGDTLSSIARLYRTTVASLKQWNKLRTNTLAIGQRLTIFTRVVATN
jgi:membrane-bound lytic murein transglycosylase D